LRRHVSSDDAESIRKDVKREKEKERERERERERADESFKQIVGNNIRIKE